MSKLKSKPPSRLQTPGPKRVLAIDGPIIRSALALQFLRQIEALLRLRTNRPVLVLSNYFDLIGGMGGGAAMAAALAAGQSVDQVEKVCTDLIPSALSNLMSFWNRRRWSGAPLDKLFPDQTFAQTEWRTGVGLITHRLDTEELLVMHNHPSGARAGAEFQGWRLRDCLEATLTSPPHQLVTLPVAPDLLGAFGEGRLGMAGGAAWPLFSLVTSPSQPFQWKMGPNDLLLVSVGCGHWVEHQPVTTASNRSPALWSSRLADLMLGDAARQSRLLFEAIARTPTPLLREAEAEDDIADQLLSEPALTFVSYDLELSEQTWLTLDLKENTALARVRF